jgi:hypothetical protein
MQAENFSVLLLCLKNPLWERLEEIKLYFYSFVIFMAESLVQFGKFRFTNKQINLNALSHVHLFSVCILRHLKSLFTLGLDYIET